MSKMYKKILCAFHSALQCSSVHCSAQWTMLTLICKHLLPQEGELKMIEQKESKINPKMLLGGIRNFQFPGLSDTNECSTEEENCVLLQIKLKIRIRDSHLRRKYYMYNSRSLLCGLLIMLECCNVCFSCLWKLL